ncbi:MAG: esterase-like activity of phytase family protein [Sandaracinaceae bacterium]
MALRRGLFLLLLSGCGPLSERPPVEESTVAVSATGLSGLTVDGAGTVYSVAERDRVLVAIEDGQPREIPLSGVPREVDLEAIAWLEGSRFVLASESADADRTEDLLFVVELEAGRARVTETVSMPYAAVGATPDDNDGIEGLCVVDGTWIAALEHPHEGLATLAVRDPDGTWSGRDMRLTTSIGKLSALSCHRARGGIRVWAIERGIDRSLFGEEWVARVLWFALPEPGQLAMPQVASDLAGRVPGQPNPEGLAFVDDEAWIVTDNHYRVRVGDTRLLRAPIRAGLLHPPP